MTARPPRPVVRDADWIGREYGQEKWPAVDRIVEDELRMGERDLSRVVSRAARRERLAGRDALDPVPFLISGTRLKAPLAVALGAYQSAITQTALSACREETDLIVELGAG